jgi:CRP-like cAMP-binding protein
MLKVRLSDTVLTTMIFFELFAHNPTLVCIESGHYLFTAGDDGHLMYVLAKGSADVILHGQVIETLQHGSIIGEMGLVSPGPRSASVLATSDCEFVAVDERRFQFLVQQTPFFATQVMRVMAERLRRTNELLHTQATAGADAQPG